MPTILQKYSFILLPGLDGTGKAYKWLIQEMTKGGILATDIEVICYEKETNYYKLVEIITKKIKSCVNPVFLIAESFAGPIALALANNEPELVKKVVLCATFGTQPECTYLPSMMMELIKFAPTSLFPLNKMPAMIINEMLMNHYGSDELKTVMADIYKNSVPEVIDRRLHQVINLPYQWEHNGFHPITQPVLILKAKHDRLISNKCSDKLLQNLPNSMSIEIEGPHLLLQTHAWQAWNYIANFANNKK